jgi:hypothetical protein
VLPPLTVEERFRLLPAHIGPLLPIEDKDGFAWTFNTAVLLADTLLLQPEPDETAVIVTVVDPVAASDEEGMVKVPLEAPMESVAVLPEEAFAPVRS